MAKAARKLSKGSWFSQLNSRRELSFLFNQLEGSLRKYEVPFTKSQIIQDFHLTAPQAASFFQLMKQRQVLVYVQKDVTICWSEQTYVIKPRPYSRPQNRQVPISKRVPGRMVGLHLCDRCGSYIPGTGRHNKSSRGHTRAVCDMELVRNIHQS